MQKAKGLIVVHNDDVYWFAGLNPQPGSCLLKIPLDQVLNGESITHQIPKSFKGNHKTLCIVPDHWFGSENYPFRSAKPSLIEPFLERKLGAAYPDRQEIRYFFNYRSVKAADGADGLCAYFLQDNKSFQLYRALEKMNLAPGKITSPGFLWEEKLAKISAGFSREGTLLIHLNQQTCLLYFYFQGNFLFSRDVVLPDSDDSMNALAFEINQSLYMFSQKTKNELSCIYFLSGEPEKLESFSETFGREIIDLNPLLDGAESVAMPELSLLDGLVKQKDLAYRASYFSVIHRQIRQEIEWKPVQWAGILIGALVLLPLFGENLLLQKMIRQEMSETQSIRQKSHISAGATLAEYETAVDRVLAIAEKPAAARAVHRILKCLPAAIKIKELEVSLEDQPELKLHGVAEAADAEGLKALLTQLVAQVRTNFETAGNFSINDIDVYADASGATPRMSIYTITLRLALI